MRERRGILPLRVKLYCGRHIAETMRRLPVEDVRGTNTGREKREKVGRERRKKNWSEIERKKHAHLLHSKMRQIPRYLAIAE
jgi:hypothetical protein